MSKDQVLIESLFQASPIGMALVSLSGQIILANDSFAKFLDTSIPELLNSSFDKCLSEEALKEDLSLREKLLSGHKVTRAVERVFVRKDEEIVFGNVGVLLLNNSFLYQVEDTTEIKRIQENLSHKSKLIALGEMASELAHDINNPLAIINLNASTIESLLCDQSEKKEILPFVQKIKQTVIRITDVLISLRKISLTSTDLGFEKVGLREIIQDAMALSAEKFKKYGVVVETQVEDVEIDCRPVEISQVVMNLLKNSFHAIKNEEVKQIEIKGNIIRGLAVIEVTDSGPGVPKEIQSKILEPFFTTKPFGEGAGLGLSVGRNIMDMHNGRIYLDTKSLKTKFVLEFPQERS